MPISIQRFGPLLSHLPLQHARSEETRSRRATPRSRFTAGGLGYGRHVSRVAGICKLYDLSVPTCTAIGVEKRRLGLPCAAGAPHRRPHRATPGRRPVTRLTSARPRAGAGGHTTRTRRRTERSPVARRCPQTHIDGRLGGCTNMDGMDVCVTRVRARVSRPNCL